jgi:hypothetical protein
LNDGPFVKGLAENAGEWRGSTNQRVIHNPSTGDCEPAVMTAGLSKTEHAGAPLAH